MTVLLIEPILDRYVAQVERREKDWSSKEVEALLLKLRDFGLPQVMDACETILIYGPLDGETALSQYMSAN